MTDGTKLLMVLLGSEMNDRGHVSMSRAAMARLINTSERRTSDRVSEAYRYGWLDRVKRGSKEGGASIWTATFGGDNPIRGVRPHGRITPAHVPGSCTCLRCRKSARKESAHVQGSGHQSIHQVSAREESASERAHVQEVSTPTTTSADEKKDQVEYRGGRVEFFGRTA